MPTDRELTPNQQLLADYLLQQIGFSIGPFTRQYLQAFYRFSHFDNYHNETVYSNIAIEVLYQEIEARKRLHAHLKRFRTNSISASDIENFTFCPAAYSIAATFHIPQTQSSAIGSDLHEKEILNPRLKKLGPGYGLGSHLVACSDDTTSTTWGHYFEDRDARFVDDIIHSEILYSDASRPNDEPFRSKTGSIIGRPDYIFRNQSTGLIYIVEEKFSLMTARRGQDPIGFYKNHTNQVRSYIYGIAQYDIAYGYLVYWRYKYDDNKLPSIMYAASKKIEKTQQAKEELVAVYKSIQSVIQLGKGIFKDSDRTPSKCANCGASIFCGHKTGKYDTYQFPYALPHATLQRVDYPLLLTQRSRIETVTLDYSLLSIKERIFRRYYQSLADTLHIQYPPNKFSKYQVEWRVKDGKLYLDRFAFHGPIVKGRSETLFEYIGKCDEAHFMHFISVTLTCYKRKETDQTNPVEEYEEIRLKITKGVAELIPPHI